MPELTGNPYLDFFLLLGAIALTAAGAFGSVKQFLNLFKKDKDPDPERVACRRTEDVEKLRDEQADHSTRIAVVETQVTNVEKKVDGVASGQETQRKETRENFQTVFDTLGTIASTVARIDQNGKG